MSDFDTRPQGTVMYGAFNAFKAAERALRVLKNAGYARAAFEVADEVALGDPTVLVVDAAKTGAARAAEILEEFGAQIYSTPPRALAPIEASPGQTAPVVSEERAAAEATIAAPLHVTSPLERKPRVRKRLRVAIPQPNAQPAASEPVPEDVTIVTRAIEGFASDG